MTWRTRPVFILAVLASGLFCMPSFAQEPAVDPATRGAARQLGYEGVEAYERGNYPDALDKLERAYQLLPVPTLALWSARALVKNRNWVAASERYLEATRLRVTREDPDVQHQAQQDAESERNSLLPKIPQLRIVIRGVPVADVTVTLNERPVPPALVGVNHPVDPGTYNAKAEWRGQRKTERFEIDAADHQEIAFDFDPSPRPPDAAGRKPFTTPQRATGEPNEAATHADSDSGSSNFAAYALLGTGALGFAAGSIAGVVAIGQKQRLDGLCEDGGCRPSLHDDVDRYDRTRLISTLGFVVGLIGTSAGVTLLVLDSPPENRPAARDGSQRALRAWIGFGPESVRTALGGRF